MPSSVEMAVAPNQSMHKIVDNNQNIATMLMMPNLLHVSFKNLKSEYYLRNLPFCFRFSFVSIIQCPHRLTWLLRQNQSMHKIVDSNQDILSVSFKYLEYFKILLLQIANKFSK